MGHLQPLARTMTTDPAGAMSSTTASQSLTAPASERPVAGRARIGFLPEQPYFYDSLTGIEYLEFVARLSGVGAHEATRASRAWLSKVGLGDRERQVLRKYSKGMLQRLGLAAAMVHGPELLILDEPMSGLDPFGRRDVRELILEQRERGTTVLFSSHILPDVEILCDRIAIVMRSELQRIATVGELVQQGEQKIEIRCTGKPDLEVPPALVSCLERGVRPHETVFVLTGDSRLPEALSWLLANGVDVRAVTPHRASLEELLMATAEPAHDRAFEAEPAERRSA